MADSFPPKLTLIEKLDLVSAQLSIVAAGIYAAITGPFRGKAGARDYGKHISYAVIRKMLLRISVRQNQATNPPTNTLYETFANKKGFTPQTVKLAHGALGHWIGNKDAKHVLVYYHGGGFAVAANIAYFELFNSIIEELNAAGKDIAIFWVTYTLTPHAVYPTQMRQSVEALRYITKDLNRAPANVFIGGDSAGGNLVFAVLSHLSHPHPEIEPLELSENLGGALAMAPWVSFSQDFPSMKENAYKDMLPLKTLKDWSDLYIAGAKGDNYNQALLAPAEWWSGLKANHVLIVLGGDEVFRSSIEQFAERLKSVVPNTTYFVGPDEPHVAPIIFRMMGFKQESAQKTEMASWLSSRL